MQVVLGQLGAQGTLDIAVHAVQVPQDDVLLDVLDRFGQVSRGHNRVAAEDRTLGEVQVRLDVAQVILLGVSKGCLPDGHRHVLVGRVLLDRRGHINHQFVDSRHLDLLEEALEDCPLVEKLGVLLHDGHNRLGLGHPLGFAEDVRVRDGNNVRHASKILPLDVQILHNLAALHIVEVPTVDSAQNTQQTALRLVQTGVNGRENGCALLDQSLGGANRGVGVDIGDLFLCRGHHTLGRARQPAQKLEKNRRRRVEWHGHGQLAHIIDARSALDLHNLGDFDLLGLARDLAALEL